jgi:hypothetical protein
VIIARTVRLAALIAVVSVAIAALGCELFYLHWLRSIVAIGHRQHLQMTPEALDKELRASLPPGTPRSAVEAALRSRHLEFSLDPAGHLIRASARPMKGSNPLGETSLVLVFRFDDREGLQRIYSRVAHSGS